MARRRGWVSQIGSHPPLFIPIRCDDFIFLHCYNQQRSPRITLFLSFLLGRSWVSIWVAILGHLLLQVHINFTFCCDKILFTNGCSPNYSFEIGPYFPAWAFPHMPSNLVIRVHCLSQISYIGSLLLLLFFPCVNSINLSFCLNASGKHVPDSIGE